LQILFNLIYYQKTTTRKKEKKSWEKTCLGEDLLGGGVDDIDQLCRGRLDKLPIDKKRNAAQHRRFFEKVTKKKEKMKLILLLY
jgi:hypothetical protein